MSITKTLGAIPWQVYAIVGVGAGLYLAAKKIGGTVGDVVTSVENEVVRVATAVKNTVVHGATAVTNTVVNPFSDKTTADTAAQVTTATSAPNPMGGGAVDAGTVSKAYDYLVGKTTDLIEQVAPLTPATPVQSANIDIPYSSSDSSGW